MGKVKQERLLPPDEEAMSNKHDVASKHLQACQVRRHLETTRWRLLRDHTDVYYFVLSLSRLLFLSSARFHRMMLASIKSA